MGWQPGHSYSYRCSPENGLVLCVPELSLEPGLWLPFVGDLGWRGTAGDLGGWIMVSCTGMVGTAPAQPGDVAEAVGRVNFMELLKNAKFWTFSSSKYRGR